MTDHLPLSQQSSTNQDNLFAALHPAMTHNWKKLAESLGVDEDFIDEIYTIETDEECLKKILNIWIKKSSPTWKEVADTLQTIGENKLAESLYIKCKTHHCDCVYQSMLNERWYTSWCFVEEACFVLCGAVFLHALFIHGLSENSGTFGFPLPCIHTDQYSTYLIFMHHFVTVTCYCHFVCSILDVLPGIVETPPRMPSSEKLSLAAEEGTKQHANLHCMWCYLLVF